MQGQQMSAMSLNNIIDEIAKLPHFQSYQCSICGYTVQYHVLQINAVCPGCGLESKVRGHGSIGTEIQDIIDAVLEWAGEGEQLEAVMARHQSIVSDKRE
jgi:hypothetical protein